MNSFCASVVYLERQIKVNHQEYSINLRKVAGETMRLKNVLIAVNDMDRAIRFYKEIFGLQVILNQDGNVILSKGLVLQDAKIWKKFLEKELIPKNNMSELYFEEPDVEAFVRRLEKSDFEIEFVNKLLIHSWGQKVVRFYDLDGNLIEVGTPVN